MSDPVQFYESANHRIAYIAHPAATGNPPIVFLHGLTASVRFWETAMLPYVRRHHPWYSISLPLHYPSSVNSKLKQPDLDERLFFQLLRDGIDQVVGPTERVILVGYSLGGFAALNFAAKAPERVLGIASIGGFANGRAKGLEKMLMELSKGQFIRKMLFHLGWKSMQLHPFFLRQAIKLYAHNTEALLSYPHLESTLAQIFPDVRHHNIEHMRMLFRYLVDMNVMDEIQRIQMPVLVLAGACDPVIPFDHQRAYAQALPQGEFHAIPNAGHVLFAEAPQQFEKLFLEWLQRIAQSAGSNKESEHSTPYLPLKRKQ